MVTLSNRTYACIKHHVENQPLVEGEQCAPCTLIGMLMLKAQSGLTNQKFKQLAEGLRREGLMQRTRRINR